MKWTGPGGRGQVPQQTASPTHHHHDEQGEEHVASHWYTWEEEEKGESKGERGEGKEWE